MSVCVSMSEFAQVSAGAYGGQKKGVRYPGAGIIGHNEQFTMDAGNRIQILYKSSV